MLMNIRLLTFLFILFLGFSCQNSGKQVSGDLVRNPKSADSKNNAIAMPEISFSKTEHDFGKLIQGEKVSYIFKFTNTGNAPLLISKVSASCGCTASKYPKEPVAPGEEAKLEVTFDSAGQRGVQNKTITVMTNTQPQSTTIRLKAQVATPDSF